MLSWLVNSPVCFSRGTSGGDAPSGASSESHSGSRSSPPSPPGSTGSSVTDREKRIRAYLIIVAVVAFTFAPVALVLADALGVARPGFHADPYITGLFIAAVISLLGVAGVDAFLRRRGGSE
jgi:hypothetical protein